MHQFLAETAHCFSCPRGWLRERTQTRLPGSEWSICFDSSLHLGWVTVTVKLLSCKGERQQEKFLKSNCIEKVLL